MQALFRNLMCAALALVAGFGTAAGKSLRLVPMESEPKAGKARLSKDDIAALKRNVEESPKDRGARFALVKGLLDSNKLEAALEAANEWRSVDAYNLVVVRMLGDIYSELGQEDRAMRTYSAVVELLPKDARSQRALASVLKQRGHLEAAYQRLAAAMVERPNDRRLAFEMADVAQRMNKVAEAENIFKKIISDESAPALLSYPARQRAAQILVRKRRQARAAADQNAAEKYAQELTELKLKEGTENDIKIYLSWDTDNSDVDLWVTNPAGEKIFYSHKKGAFGGSLFGDVTRGYGPESFTASKAQPGTYLIQVHYYSSNSSNFPEARGEVTVVLNEGKEEELRTVLPYKLFKAGQKVKVGKIVVR
jgi:tetratricopeptide (TPR) repeat protein